MKGNLRMPKDVVYTDALDADTLAGVMTKKGKYYGWFGVNKKVFDNIDKSIEKSLEDLDMFVKFEKDDKGKWIAKSNSLLNGESVRELLKQFEKYKEGNFSFNQKVDFYSSLDVLKNTVNAANCAPDNFIKQLLDNPKLVKIFEDNNIITDLAKIKQLSTGEQVKVLKSMINQDGVKVTFTFDIKSLSSFDTIYHEMGHIQDMVPRCLATDKYKFDYSKYSDELKAWVDNQENMQVANRVSEYASHGPGEFIAETFARMIQGNQLPEEVLALYKKLKGPAVPGY